MNNINTLHKDWFETLMGFKEKSPEQVRKNIIIDGDKMKSLVNENIFQFGKLEIVSLAELQRKSLSIDSFKNKISVSELVGNIQSFHQDPSNSGALFQAASQFNLLEMVGPQISPEKGIGIYELDYTQGPACAIACGAGTIYRNYFVPVNRKIGQTINNQIDCLDEVGKVLGNNESELWNMTNGYVIPSQKSLGVISDKINKLDSDSYQNLKAKLKIGVQWDTELTIGESNHTVSQVYCSALPVAYSYLDSNLWEPFAQLILEATYEATLFSALINMRKTGNNKVYLTLVGGGAFGNENCWIKKALLEVLIKFKNTPLDVKIVSFGSSNSLVSEIINELNLF